jgi:ribonuclease PH
MVALSDLVQDMLRNRMILKSPIQEFLSAVSVGINGKEVLCDLCYEEDSQADVDMNLVMTESGRIVEIQGTAEKTPFSTAQLNEMLGVGKKAIDGLIAQVKGVVLEPKRI